MLSGGYFLQTTKIQIGITIREKPLQHSRSNNNRAYGKWFLHSLKQNVFLLITKMDNRIGDVEDIESIAITKTAPIVPER